MGVRLRLEDALDGDGDKRDFPDAVTRFFFFFFEGEPPLIQSVDATELTLGEGDGSFRFRFLRLSSSSVICGSKRHSKLVSLYRHIIIVVCSATTKCIGLLKLIELITNNRSYQEPHITTYSI